MLHLDTKNFKPFEGEQKVSYITSWLIALFSWDNIFWNYLKKKFWFYHRSNRNYELSNLMSEKEIIDLIKSTEYWHWTWVYKYWWNHYQNKWGDDVINILDDVVKNGLVPQYDPINKLLLDKNITHTTSLTKNRMYARCYSEQYNNEELCHVFGHRRYWINWYMAFIWVYAIDLNLLKSWAKFQIEKLKKHTYNILNKKYNDSDWFSLAWWLWKNRKSIKPWKWQSERANWLSDIQWNYGIILWIKPHRVHRIPIKNKWVSLFEYRTNTVISPEDIQYIEVPRKNYLHLKEYLELQEKKDIPVVIMEDVEKIVRSNFSVKELSIPL